MKSQDADSKSIDAGRRKILRAAGACAVASAIAPAFAADRPLRWGIVGTGSIANGMASMMKVAANTELVAVASRKIETAREFANKHGISGAFGSWADMVASKTIDAVYVATPTSVREEVCLAAAANGKHVL